MDSPITRIDELLSGMLDGVLTEAESVELDREMVKDPSLEARLDELAALRKSLMSGRSTKGLRPDFASSVTLAAKKRAAELGVDAPIWLGVDRPEGKIEKTFAPVSPVSGVSRQWMLVSVCSLAAALLVAFFALPKQEPDFTGEGFVQLPTTPGSDPAEESSKIATEKPASSLETLGTDKNRPESDLVQSDVKSLESKLLDGAKTVTNEPAVESKTSLVAPIDLPKSDLVATAPSDKSNSQKPLKNSKPAPLLLVFDFEVEEQAVENRVLERILDKYGIVYTDELVIDDDQLTKLQESQLVGVSGGEEKMGVLFLRSSALNLGLALEAIIVDSTDFPAYTMNVTANESVRLLVQQLSNIEVADSPNGFAGRLSLATARGNPMPFTASVSRAKRKSNEAGSFSGLLPAHQEMSNVLFLLRPAKK